MGKKTKKPGKGKEKTERKTAKAEEKRARREGKKVSEEDDIDAILVRKRQLMMGASLFFFLTFFAFVFRWLGNLSIYQRNIQKEEAKKKEVHVQDNVPGPSPRSNCSVGARCFLATSLCTRKELHLLRKTFYSVVHVILGNYFQKLLLLFLVSACQKLTNCEKLEKIKRALRDWKRLTFSMYWDM